MIDPGKQRKRKLSSHKAGEALLTPFVRPLYPLYDHSIHTLAPLYLLAPLLEGAVQRRTLVVPTRGALIWPDIGNVWIYHTGRLGSPRTPNSF